MSPEQSEHGVNDTKGMRAWQTGFSLRNFVTDATRNLS